MDRTVFLWLCAVSPPLRLLTVGLFLLARLSVLHHYRPTFLPPCSPPGVVPRVQRSSVSVLPPAVSAGLAPLRTSYTRDQLIAASTTGARLDHDMISRLKTLSIGVNLPRKRSCRGGRRKRRKIEVICGARSLINHLDTPSTEMGTVPPSILSDISPMPPQPQGCNLSNLVTIPLQHSVTLPNQLCLCVFNAQSVGKSTKRSAICDFVRDHDVDLVLLTETWLRQSGDEAKCSDLTPSGYTLFSFPRSHNSKIKRGGGLAFIIKDSLAEHCTTATDFPFSHVSFELAQLTLKIHQQRVSFFLVYRPPPNKKNELSNSHFFEELPDFLEFCVDCQNSIFIAGDFNFHFDDAMDVNTRKLCDQLDMFSLVQTVTEPTHASGHILDLVVHKDVDNLIHSTHVCHDLASDHFSVLCHLAIEKPKRLSKFISTRSVSKIDHDKFSSDIAQSLTPNMSISDLNSTLAAVFDAHAPVRQLKVRSGKPTPWYSAVAVQLQELKRERRRAERAWSTSRSTVHTQIYDMAKQKVSDLVDSAKTSFYSSLVSSSVSCKQLFHNMSSLLGKTKKVSLPAVSDVKLLPNMFADFFKNKILAIRDNFPPVPQRAASNSVAFSGTPLVEFSPVSEDFVRKVILQTTPKSCELDPMPTKLLFQHIDLLLPTITNIMNESLIAGIFPTEFKTAVVKPLLKKPNLDPNNLKNYRPISNLPFLSKLLERLILHQLFSHLTTHSLLSVHQSAYRAGHSTETVLIRILNDLLVSLDQGKVSILLLLDLSAAFDTIDHEVLLSRLEHDFGIKSTALDWFLPVYIFVELSTESGHKTP